MDEQPKMNLTFEEWKARDGNGGGCPDCGMKFPDNVEKMIYSYTLDGLEYADSESSIVYLGTDGKFWVWEEWGDSSGHGCQCHFSTNSFATLEDAVRFGLNDEARGKLGLTL